MESDETSEAFRQWATLDAQVKNMESRRNRLRERLMETVITNGFTDEKGNTFFDLPATIEVAGKKFKGIKREARVTTTVNEERALALAEAKGILNEVVVMVPQIDLDALYAAYQRGKITADEIDSVNDTKKSFAFKPVAE